MQHVEHVVASQSQQGTCLPCVAVAGKGPPLILVQEYLKGGEPFSTLQCRDRASPTTSRPSTQHFGTEGFTKITQEVGNFPRLEYICLKVFEGSSD